MRALRVRWNVSQRHSLEIGRYFSRRCNVPLAKGLKQAMVEDNKRFADLFDVVHDAPSPTVVCNDGAKFLDRVALLRGVDLNNSTMIVGIDKGDNTVKVSATILTNDAGGVPRTSSIGDGNFATAGVKRLVVFGCSVADESYEVVEQLMRSVPTTKCRFAMALDHKTKSVVCGLQGGSSTHWCELCDYNHNDGDGKEVEHATARTFQSLHRDAADYKAASDRHTSYTAAVERWKNSGVTTNRPQRVKAPRAKDYNNVHRPPMPFLPRTGDVWDIIPPCALHLTINVVSRCTSGGMSTDAEGGRVARVMTAYVVEHLHLKKFGPRDEWEGGKCLRIVAKKNTDALLVMIRAACAAGEASLLYDFYDMLQSFKKLHTACFGETFTEAPATAALKEFRDAYLAVFPTVSRTVHVLLRHVIPFCRSHRCGLNPYTEQAHESLHRVFRLQHHLSHRSNVEHPQFAEFLLSAVLRLNSLNCGAAASREDDAKADDDDTDDDSDGGDGDSDGEGHGPDSHPPQQPPDDTSDADDDGKKDSSEPSDDDEEMPDAAPSGSKASKSQVRCICDSFVDCYCVVLCARGVV